MIYDLMIYDLKKRYDVYCSENDRETVVYRNVLFKGTKMLLPAHRRDALSEFVELEQVQGGSVFVPRVSIIKFCEQGATPSAERPGTKRENGPKQLATGPPEPNS